ncbi:MAG: class II fructose-bisphosphate aldolase [Anaerolineae bacterium]|jgi:fructose/tagatose bisphosphate aldolase|nr:class II fructose-bisphosphate aldolase [Anaerolineae bacterium]
MKHPVLPDLLALLDGSVSLQGEAVEVKDAARLRATIHRLAEVSALESGVRQGLARYLVRQVAQALGIYSASINELYLARGRGELPNDFTVPAMNLRALAFDSARAVFRAALKIDAAAIIFEIARSEMGYTDQRPAEYVTSVLAAAIAEGYTGPVFIQGDHFQVSAKRYAADPDAEVQAIKDLIDEALAAGFFNIDIDTSTLVDLDKPTVPEQQELNTSLSAMFAAYIRSREPQGVTVSIGGEIGEVGGQNSTPEELRGYMDGFNARLAVAAPGAVGISKISIQTGTSHGGVVLPDGSIAQVSVDFGTLRQLSEIARLEYGLGGAVQHGASTLPEAAFSKFAENEAVEVHLATNFQTMLFDRLPDDLRQEMYAFLDEKHAAERKPGVTAEQFYYKTRKYAVGPFKKQTWNMPAANKEAINQAWEAQFDRLFRLLGLAGTRKIVDQTVRKAAVKPDPKFYLGEAVEAGDVSDLAD